MGRVVICDECVPRGFASLLGDRFDVTTVVSRGWTGCSDELLLERLRRHPGAVLVTMDQGFRWVHPPRLGTAAVVLLHSRSSQLFDLVELVRPATDAIRRCRAGQVLVVKSPPR